MKEELTGKHRQVISTSKKEELQEGDLIKAKGKGIRKLTDNEQKSHPREKKQEPEQQPQPPMWRTRNSIH